MSNYVGRALDPTAWHSAVPALHGGVRMPTNGIARWLRAARKRRGWSRETLAHYAGISGAAIAQIESGRRADPRVSSLVRLADALDVSVDELVRGTASNR